MRSSASTGSTTSERTLFAVDEDPGWPRLLANVADI